MTTPRMLHDNAEANGSVQNSLQLNWFAQEVGFDPNVAGRYQITLSGTPSLGQPQSLSVVAQLVGVNAVPEPATWAMMIGGFGMLGAAARRRTRTTVTYA